MDPYKMVIAVANQKGGCAKTTTAVNLAAALARGHKKMGLPPAKVLLIDLDPQGNCATSFGIEKKRVKKTAYDLLTNDLGCLLYTSPSPRDLSTSRMPSSA